MTSDYIYIKLCSNKSISLSNLKIKLKDKSNKIVFNGTIDCFGKLKIPVVKTPCKNIYKYKIKFK